MKKQRIFVYGIIIGLSIDVAMLVLLMNGYNLHIGLKAYAPMISVGIIGGSFLYNLNADINQRIKEMKGE